MKTKEEILAKHTKLSPNLLRNEITIISNNALLAMDEYANQKTAIKDNEIELLKEDIECVHMFLDDLKVPRKDDKAVFSIVGRILYLLKKNLNDILITKDENRISINS